MMSRDPLRILAFAYAANLDRVPNQGHGGCGLG